MHHLKYQGEKSILLLRIMGMSEQFSRNILEFSLHNKPVAWVLHACFDERLPFVSGHEHQDAYLKDINLITGNAC
jgi:hypothetical protein